MKKEHISYYISFATILVSFASLGIACYRKDGNLEFDYLGVITGMLAVLVTVLIGLQLYNYIYARDHVQRIIDDAIQKMVSDFSHVTISREHIINSFEIVITSFDCPKIADGIMKALDEISRCENLEMRQHSLDYIMNEAHKMVTDYSQNGKFIYKDKRAEYLHILKQIDHKYQPELFEFVKIAVEMDKTCFVS